MTVRLATESDHPWITARNEQAGFLRANFAKDTVVVAEIDGKKAALGRTVPIGENSVELSGIFVEELFRGRGVAKEVIDYLLEQQQNKTVYCIPFKHLEALYKSIGFAPCEDDNVPQEIKDKFAWCKKRYDPDVTLLVKKPG